MWRKRKTKINYDKLPVKHIDREAELEKIIKELEDKPKYCPTLWLGLDGLRFYPEGPKWIHKDVPVPPGKDAPILNGDFQLKYKVGDMVKLKESAVWYAASDGNGLCDMAIRYDICDKFIPITNVMPYPWTKYPYRVGSVGWFRESDFEEVRSSPRLLNTSDRIPPLTVKRIQHWLNQNFGKNLEEDGMFGDRTLEAICEVKRRGAYLPTYFYKGSDIQSLKFEVGDLVKLKETAFWYEASDGSGKCDSAYFYGATKRYLPITIVNKKAWATHPYHIGKYGWVKESDIAEVIPHEPDGIESKMQEHGWDLYYHGVKVPQNVVYGYGPGELPTQQIGDTIYIYPAPHPEVYIDGRVY